MRSLCIVFLAAMCVATSAITTSQAADIAVPRVVIGIYDSAHDNWNDSFLHQMAEMPLNHMGLILERWDLANGLPDLKGRRDVRGIILASEGDSMPEPDRFTRWASDAIDAGLRVVLIGTAQLAKANNGTPASTSSVDRFLAQLGLRQGGNFDGLTFDSEIVRKDPRMVEYERSFEGGLPSYDLIQSFAASNRVYLTVRRKGSRQNADLVVTGPWGGYVASAYTHYSNPAGTYNQWYLNPFAYFAEAFNSDEMPKPDVTTLNGRRIFLSHIDGDGWRNISEIPKYRQDHRLSSDVILHEVLEKYRDLPVTVAPIGADLDTAWCGTRTSIEIARQILALPQVELGSHTYSHPLAWEFYGRPNVDEREKPFLPLYRDQCGSDTAVPTALGRIVDLGSGIASMFRGGSNSTPPATPGSKQPANLMAPAPTTPAIPAARESLDVEGASDLATMDDPVPRSYAIKPYDLAREVGGSVALIESLAPPGKKVALFQWSGNALPYRDAIAATRAAGLRNMNGGDSRLDKEFPSVSSVAPVGREVGDQWQVYAPNSNENTYTNLWNGRYFGFRYLIYTLENTEHPTRLRPINVYYHMYSGEKTASLTALQEVLDYVRDQKIAPIRASEYAAIGDGFFSTQIVKTGERTWRFARKDRLSTIRFDHADELMVDFAKSIGVLGQSWDRGTLYVALDPAVAEATVALQQKKNSAAVRPYLMESRWPIRALSIGDGNIAYDSEGFGPGEMRWQVGKQGDWRIDVIGAANQTPSTITARANPAGVLAFDIGFGDGRPVRVRMTPRSQDDLGLNDGRPVELRATPVNLSAGQ